MMKLVDIISIFRRAQRIGSTTDDPEGSRYIQISDTLAIEIERSLVSLLEAEKQKGLSE